MILEIKWAPRALVSLGFTHVTAHMSKMAPTMCLAIGAGYWLGPSLKVGFPAPGG